MHDVLISYSSKDKAIADEISNQLVSKGIRVWIAPRYKVAGESYPSVFYEGIRNNSTVNSVIQGLELYINQVIKHQLHIYL